MNFFDVSEEVVKKDEVNSLWVEKYRPKSVDDYIGNDSLKNSLKKYIKDNDVPHILLHSKESGTGKTTAAKMIVGSIDCDYLYVNASDENSVDVIRTKIKGFASTLGFKSLKVVILDEGDCISFEGQAALRNLMETYSKHTRFIITCNYVDKILGALKSRSQSFEVVPPSQKDIMVHIAKILKKENVSYKPDNVAFLVKSFYPDIRKMLNFAQQNTFDGVLKTDEKKLVEGDTKLKLISILKEKGDLKTKFGSIRQLIADAGISSFSDWYKYLYNKIDDYCGSKGTDIILIIAEAEYRDAFVIDKEINFSACIINILNELK